VEIVCGVGRCRRDCRRCRLWPDRYREKFSTPSVFDPTVDPILGAVDVCLAGVIRAFFIAFVVVAKENAGIRSLRVHGGGLLYGAANGDGVDRRAETVDDFVDEGHSGSGHPAPVSAAGFAAQAVRVRPRARSDDGNAATIRVVPIALALNHNATANQGGRERRDRRVGEQT